jgi:glyoxylase-like metal-dependent hydrolase (beta-lactamase superfamily II)
MDTRIDIGTYTIEPIQDSVSRGDPTRMYPGTGAADWADHPGTLDGAGALQFGIGSYLVRDGTRTMLVDLGVGPSGWHAPSGAVIPPGHLLDNLRRAGVDPAGVTDVLLSHIHPDHVGWASIDGRPVFERATYRCHRADWDHFVAGRVGDPTVWPLMEAVADRLEPWDDDDTLFPGLDLIAAPGHTPGSTILTFSDPSGARAILLGDVVHCPVELVDDEWATIADVDPELAMLTKRRVARELTALADGATDVHVSAAHFPELRFGRLVLDEDRVRHWGYG